MDQCRDGAITDLARDPGAGTVVSDGDDQFDITTKLVNGTQPAIGDRHAVNFGSPTGVILVQQADQFMSRGARGLDAFSGVAASTDDAQAAHRGSP